MSIKENFRHFTVLNGQNQDGWNTNQNQMKKTIHTLFTLGCSRKKTNRGGGGAMDMDMRIWKGYQRNSMWNFQGWPRKNYVEFSGVLFLVLEFPRDVMQFFTISRGKLNKRKVLGGLWKQYVVKSPVCFFSGIAHCIWRFKCTFIITCKMQP